MGFDTDWDVDYYKTDYESDEHWELRRAFIEAHKDKFPENELVCLAQVFTNIEFLGCRYPAETMERVALLSKDVAETFRKSRESKLKRTFVGASDAAGAKAKGRNSQSTKPMTVSKNARIPSLQSTFQRETKPNLPEDDQPTNSTNNINSMKRKANDDEDDDEEERPSFSMTNSTDECSKNSHQQPSTSTTSNRLQHNKRIPDTGFVILETISGPKNDLSILQTSAAKQGAVIKFDTEASKNPSATAPLNAVIYVNGKVYGVAPITQSKQESKIEAYANALNYARKIHYTIKQKEVVDTVAVACQNKDEENASAAKSESQNQICSDNKGFKMMKMLGWTGGALGTSGDGIKEPVSIEMKVDRSGLGLSSESSKLNYDHFYNYLTKYKTDEAATYDLVFSKEFDKDERKSLHEIANRLSLRSRSRNDPDGGRYLVIQKKISLLELANDIYNGGLQSRYYELIPPTEPLPQPKPPAITQRPKQTANNTFAMNYKQRQGNARNQRQQNKQKFRKF